MKSLFLSFLAAVLALSVTAVSAQTLVAAPASANFGAVTPGSTNNIAMTLTNSGTSALTIGSITISGSLFSDSGVANGKTFPVNGGSAFDITFTAPATGGPFTGTVTITSNGPTITIPLSAALTSAVPTGTAVNLICTPSLSSTTANPGTTSLLRAVSPSTTFTSLATGLAPNCAYSDTAVAPGTTYDYYAEFTQNGETSVASNIATVSVPSSVAKTTPTVSVVASATSPASNTAVEVTISVTGTGTVPTGSIVVAGAGFTSVASVLANGTVVITIPVNTLTTGASNFVATYTPDATSSSVYNTATGSEAVIVIPAAPAALGGTVN